MYTDKYYQSPSGKTTKDALGRAFVLTDLGFREKTIDDDEKNSRIK